MAQVETNRRESAITLGLVGLGGAAGTVVRYLLATAIPTPNGIPIGILLINVFGAFLLATVISYLALRGTRDLREQRLRLLVATGFMGGFTTYSSFADDTAQLLDANRLTASVLYLFATLVIGGLASWLGIFAGRTLGTRAEPGESGRA